MASPIFISNPSEAFSIWLILRGITLSILSNFRSLQNPAFLSTSFLSTTVKLSLLLYISINGPLYLTSASILLINYFNIWNFNSLSILIKFKFFIENVFNWNIFLISLVGFIDPTLDNLFLSSLKFIDQINGSNYYKNINRLPNTINENITGPQNSQLTIVQKYQILLKNSKYFKKFLTRYFQLYFFNLCIYTLVQFSSHYYRLSTIILHFISFQIFQDKLGTFLSILLVALLNLLPLNYTFSVLTTFYSSSNLTIDLLTPYIQRLNLSSIELKQWLNSRQGVLFGFGIVNYLLITKFPQFVIVWYVLGQLNIAYLIYKITDTPPAVSSSKLINWSSTQLVWDKSNPNFWINDPYISIHGILS